MNEKEETKSEKEFCYVGERFSEGELALAIKVVGNDFIEQGFVRIKCRGFRGLAGLHFEALCAIQTCLSGNCFDTKKGEKRKKREVHTLSSVLPNFDICP